MSAAEHARLWAAAAACALAALCLGLAVARREPVALDRAAFALRGRAVRIAYVFTLLGRWPAIISLGVLAVGLAMNRRDPLDPVIAVLAVQVISQVANSLLKLGYRRPRPYEFIGNPEREMSYPSGHAVSALVFFGGFAVLATHAGLPRALESALVALLLVCVVAIPWSRLALGAHYLSDVAGGMLLGGAWLCATLAAYPW